MTEIVKHKTPGIGSKVKKDRRRHDLFHRLERQNGPIGF